MCGVGDKWHRHLPANHEWIIQKTEQYYKMKTFVAHLDDLILYLGVDAFSLVLCLSLLLFAYYNDSSKSIDVAVIYYVNRH